MKCDLQDLKDLVYLFNSLCCLSMYPTGSTYPAYRNGRRNWRLSLRRHVRRRTFRNAYAKIAEPIDVSKPAECRNYSLRCTLCSGFSVHPFSFSPSSLRMSALRFRGCTHTFSLPPSPRLHLSGHSRPSVSRLSSCDNPIPLCVNSCTHRQRIPTGEHTVGTTFTLHNAGDLCFFLCATSVTLFREATFSQNFHHLQNTSRTM